MTLQREDSLYWLLAGEPGGHQARQQEEDRADPTSSAGTQTRECLTLLTSFSAWLKTTLAYLLLLKPLITGELALFSGAHEGRAVGVVESWTEGCTASQPWQSSAASLLRSV